MEPHPILTSYDAAIGPAREDLVIRAINLRLATLTGTMPEQCDPLSILCYAPGQQYHPHMDARTGTKNQRLKTVIIYLNYDYAGGSTFFEANDTEIVGKAGSAILLDNVTSDGRPDPLSKHAGLPVTNGNKWIATHLIRSDPIDVWTNKGLN